MCKRGSIILTPFPFTDLSGNKVRPALVLSKNVTGSDLVVVFITSQKKLKEPHLVPVTPSSGNGLKVHSQIVCGKIATLDTKVVLGELGTLEAETLKRVNKTLKEVLGL